MGLNELVRSKGYKNFMAKLYGIGASVVILGAMFKIMHWPGANPMIVLGMSTEAIIFLFSTHGLSNLGNGFIRLGNGGGYRQ